MITSYLASVNAAAADALSIGPYLLLPALLIASTVNLACYRYIKNLKRRAAAERKRAEGAERRAEKLNRHLAEQERTTEALRESEEYLRNATLKIMFDTHPSLLSEFLLNSPQPDSPATVQ